MTVSNETKADGLLAGSAAVDLTPQSSVFLFGYPHVPRYSAGVSDPLLCTAFYLRSDDGCVLFLANDLIFVPKAVALRVRRRISARASVPEECIIATATHTHSGPMTVDYVSNGADPAVPRADPEYLRLIEDRMVLAGLAAVERAVPAEIGMASATTAGLGGNRHDPAGPSDPEVPVVLARTRSGGVPIACMVVCAMHPTVLHEDSLLISGDFPGFARRFLHDGVLPPTCGFLFHNGASGNQSPRHVTRGNTLSEARRLGEILGRSIRGALSQMEFTSRISVGCSRGFVEMVPRRLVTGAEAVEALRAARERLAHLRAESAPRHEVRTAECDLFGAEETVELTRAAADGRLGGAVDACSPAEIQVVRLGARTFAAWPGEFFVEYALALKTSEPSSHVITMANGELQGYIVTAESAARGDYEAGNAIFSHENGARVVAETLRLIRAASEAGGAR